MGIKFKYDAAGVTPPSNQSTRRFGQQMVLGEQQRKYQGQQAGYDRLFQLGRDVQQNAFQVDRDNRIADFQQQQAVDQGLRQANRDKTLFDQQQRAKDFADARARLDTYAKEVVNDPSTPQEVRTKIQNLLSGKMAVLAGGYEAPAQQQFLDQYNSQLAGYLSEIPPKAPPPTPEQALQGFLGDEQYARYGHLPWVADGKGGFSVSKDALGHLQKEQEQQQKELEAGRPKSFQDYYNANEDKFDKDLNTTMQSMQDSLVPDDKGNVPTVTREQALEQMQKDYDFRQKALGRPQYGDPTSAPTMPGAAPADQGQMRSILETGQPAGIAPGSALARQRDALGMNATAPSATQPAMGGQPPAPEQANSFGQRLAEGRDALKADPSNKEAKANLESLVKASPTLAPLYEAYAKAPKGSDEQRSAQKAYSEAFYKEMQSPGQSPLPTQSQPAPEAANWDSPQSQGGITMESASMASKQYESAAQELKTLQSQVDAIDGQIRGAKGKGGRSGILSANQNQRLTELKKEQQRIKAEMQSKQKMMQDADKAVRSYYDQQVAQQPAAQKLAKAGKRPQDFAEAELQLRNLRKQYPDMSSMPPEAKKQLQDAMAVIQAGR